MSIEDIEGNENFEELLKESFKKEDKGSGDLTEGIIVQINEDENQAVIVSVKKMMLLSL